MWMAGVCVKASFERENSAMLVTMAALSDGSKAVLSAEPGYRESTQRWSRVPGYQKPRDGLFPTGGRRRTPLHRGSASQRLS